MTPNFNAEVEKFISFYIKSYGEEKFNAIKNKIDNSNKVKKFLGKSSSDKIILLRDDFVFTINEIPYFIFSHPKTSTMGAILALRKWNDEINSQLFLASDFQVLKVLNDIIDKYWNKTVK